MADGMIGAAPAGQTGTPEAAPVQQQQTAQQQAQPQVNYVTSEQLNADLILFRCWPDICMIIGS